MKCFCHVPVAFVCMFLPFSSYGQNFEQSSVHYRQYVSLVSNNASRESVVQAAYLCYQDFSALLDSDDVPIFEVNETRERMMKIMPQLFNGAAIYQSTDTHLALQYAKAYVGIRSLKAFQDFSFPSDANYPQLLYFIANTSFKMKSQSPDVIKYARLYLSTGDTKNRKYAFWLMAQSYQEREEARAVLNTMVKAIDEFPDEFAFLVLAINTYVDNEDLYDVDSLQKYVTMAMKFKPDDLNLLDFQGKIYEEKGDYLSALGLYTRIRALKPNIFSVEEHLAVNSYNVGVLYNNKCLMLSSSSPEFIKNSRMAVQYFAESLVYINNILNAQPNSVKYLGAQAVAYQFTGNATGFASTNAVLSSLGAATVPDNYVPFFLSSDPKKSAESVRQSSTASAKPQEDFMQDTGHGRPPYSQFMKQYVESNISVWQEKGEFETTEQYMARVNVRSRDAKVAALKEEAVNLYVSRYSIGLKIQNLSLERYDADNQTYLINSEYGDMILPVPLANNEAMVFKNSWSGVQLADAKYTIVKDDLRISSLTFITPIGQRYRYDSSSDSDYGTTEIEFNFADIDYGSTPGTVKPDTRKSNVNTISVGASDVDVNIPKSGILNETTFAFIIANENYTMVPEVRMALNDGDVFAEYCRQTLGIPESQIKMYRNATFGNMHSAVSSIKQYAKIFGTSANFIFYYSGHGIPDESDKGAYLLPVDADGTSTAVCYSLNTLYDELGRTGANSVVAFIDACFSGASRDGGMLSQDAKGVALSPRMTEPSGNMVVFSAASSSQTAYPYKEKLHGMFTYFLLKILQESEGRATLKEIGDYLITNVSRSSLSINGKLQTPVVRASSSVHNWEAMKLIH